MAASSIGTLKASLVLDTSGWTGGFASATKSLEGFSSGLISKATGFVKGFGISLASAGASAVTAGFGFHQLMESLGNVGHLVTISKKLGLTVEETQRLAFAANQSGIELDTVADG